MEQVILIEFKDGNMDRLLEYFKKSYNLKNVYEIESLSSEEEVNNILFKNNNSNLIYLSEESFILIVNDDHNFYSQTIKFALTNKLSIHEKHLIFFIRIFLNDIVINFLSHEDMICISLKNTMGDITIHWTFNQNVLFLEEDVITPEIFKKFTNNIFDIENIILSVLKKFAEEYHFYEYETNEGYKLAYETGIRKDTINLKKKEFYYKEKEFYYKNLLEQEIFKYTDRDLIFKKNRKKNLPIDLSPDTLPI